MNAKMPELKAAFESAGFTEVRTLLSSGNVVFNARSRSETAVARKAEAAMKKHLGRAFLTIVRSTQALDDLIQADPYSQFRLPARAKRVVTFLRQPREARLRLPIEKDGARILATTRREVLTAYVPARWPVFMTLIEKTLGKDVTTRTWDTVKKCAAA